MLNMEAMSYIEIPLHGKYGEGKFTLVDGDYDGEYFSQYRWYLGADGYAVRAEWDSVKGNNKLIKLHHEVLRTDKTKVGHFVRDHIDGNKLNNRSCNLRLVTQSHNRGNTHSKGKLATGVYQYKHSSKYYVKVRGKYIGSYKTPEEAAVASQREAERVYGTCPARG